MSYNNKPVKAFLPIVISLSVLAGLALGFFLPRGSAVSNHTGLSQSDKISSVLRIIDANYVDTVNYGDLEETAIPAILKKLDPHSVYIPARDLKRANEPLRGNFDGIGISFNLITDTILVISTIPGGPSEKAGLVPGDKIIYVNDSLVAGKKITDEDAMGMLKGQRGTVVKLKILRRGVRDLLSFEITRDKIPIYSVDVAYMVNNSTGYIRINNFAVTTYDEFMKGMTELMNSGLKNLVLDLRGNSGGVMESANRIANEFLKKGQLIVYTKGRKQPRSNVVANGSGKFQGIGLVVLIDEWSASASEILAGAIQDNDRGTIIGRRSFGKGLVQEPVSFSDGSGMRLTVARYYTPTGRSIQKPYNEGTEKYYEEMHERFARGEMLDKDSIHFANGQKFTTPGGKTVYGGGGIMPDIFIPADTTGITRYFIAVRNNLIYRYALQYTESNREKLSAFKTAAELEEYLDRQDLLNKFIKYAEANGIKKDPEGIRVSGKIIHTQVKAYIARNILDNKGFYPVWEDIDTTLKSAIDYISRAEGK